MQREPCLFIWKLWVFLFEEDDNDDKKEEENDIKEDDEDEEDEEDNEKEEDDKQEEDKEEEKNDEQEEDDNNMTMEKSTFCLSGSPKKKTLAQLTINLSGSFLLYFFVFSADPDTQPIF